MIAVNPSDAAPRPGSDVSDRDLLDDAGPADAGESELERLSLDPEDLVCGPSGANGPWRVTASAGGRQLNDRDFSKPFEMDWAHFSIQVMREILAEGGAIHFDLTHLRGIPELLDGDGDYGSTITARELRWLRGRWERDSEAAIVFWDDVEFRDGAAWGRLVTPPWEWTAAAAMAHEARLAARAGEDGERVA